jgi:hypothetical protein
MIRVPQFGTFDHGRRQIGFRKANAKVSVGAGSIIPRRR